MSECSAERLIANDEEGTSCTVSILGYPAAIDKRKVGPPIEAGDLAGRRSSQAEGEENLAREGHGEAVEGDRERSTAEDGLEIKTQRREQSWPKAKRERREVSQAGGLKGGTARPSDRRAS